MVSMKLLSTEQRARILAWLVEGSSIRATCRTTGAAKGTVLKFLIDLGAVCEDYHDRHVRGIQGRRRIQADEIWCFVSKKDKHVRPEDRDNPDAGSAWTWTALDTDSKLMLAWHVGTRDGECARQFMLNLAGRVTGRIQLTTDGHWAYRSAVPDVFGKKIDYGVLVKHYAEPRQGEARYSPCECIGTEKKAIIGRMGKHEVCTSHVERANLTLRMSNRRFTRLTNAFSRRLANLRASVSIHYHFYNFARVHQTLRVTPAMEAGLADHVWELSEIVALLEAEERKLIGTAENKRGPYRKAKNLE